jgi:hypothetical protein
VDSQADPEYYEPDYGSGETQIQSKSISSSMVRKLISAPSRDEHHDESRHLLPHYPQSHKRYENKVEAIRARRSYESVEQPYHPLDPSNVTEYASESENEPELEDVRNTPYSGQSRTDYVESPHREPKNESVDLRRHNANTNQYPRAQHDEPEDEYEGESSRVSRVFPDV